jgi:hypothetical protein
VSASWFQIDPVMLFQTDPFSMKKALPVQLAVLALFSVRVSRNGSPDIDIPPFAFVTPLPLSVPPDHVSSPLTVNVSIPVNVPELWFTVAVVIAFPVEKFNVPPLIVNGPTLVTVTGTTKFATPLAVTSVPLVTSYVPV